jgi:octaprenyl-diphosphate synthase
MLAQSESKIVLKNSSPIHQLFNHFAKNMDKVDFVITQHLESPVPLVSIVASHLIRSGGKRLRPLLTLASSELFSPPLNDGPLYLAAAIEFIHTATLLHDDVIDLSDLRRGEKSANSLWGNHASILVGDFLFAQAFHLMVKCDHLEMLGILSKTSAIIAEGEVFQLSMLNNLSITLDDHLKIIGSKTAELFAAACRAGACLTSASKTDCDALYDYGYNLGMAFQLSDDILDYTATTQTLGKRQGDDFREGKITLPIIYALETASEEEKTFWMRTLVHVNQTDDDLKTALDLIHRRKGFDRAFNLALSYSEKAIQSLSHLSESPLKSILCDVAHFVTTRES